VKNDQKIFRLKCEPRSSASSGEHHTQLMEYDVRMRQEEEKYSKLLAELAQTRWLHLSDLHRSDDQNGFAKCNVDEQNMEKSQLSEMEVTRLSGEEILHGSSLTMEQVLLKHGKSSMLQADESMDRTSTLHLITFQGTLSLQKRNDSHSLLVGMQTECNAQKKSDGKESIPWESIMIESNKSVLQGWMEIYSPSLSMPSQRNGEKRTIVYNLLREKQKEH
jgi:hypothetical protein